MIAAGAVVADGRVHRPGWVSVGEAQILDAGAGNPPAPAEDAFPDGIVVPGFVDIHCHGGAGRSYADTAEAGDAADVVVALHARHGTTRGLASLVSAAPQALLAQVRALAAATRRGVIDGIHLEGPWLSRRYCGAHDTAWLRDPDPAELDALLSAGDGAIRMVTLAPERRGGLETIGRLVDAGVVVAVGHTDASFEQTQAAIDAGASVGTHLFNAMRPLQHREPGPVAALLADSRVSVELIADGVHLHPAVIRHVVATAGPHRVALVTDAMAAAGVGDGAFGLGGLDVDVSAGVARLRGTATIAGSTATMDRVFSTTVELLRDELGFDGALAAAVTMCSATPSGALGAGAGRVVRASADLVVLDGGLQVQRVMRRGRWLT